MKLSHHLNILKILLFPRNLKVSPHLHCTLLWVSPRQKTFTLGNLLKRRFISCPFLSIFFYLFLYIVQIFQIVKWMFGLKYFVEYLCIFFLQKLGGGEGFWEVFWCVAQLCCAEQKRSAWKPYMEQISSIFFTLFIIKKVFDQVVKAIFNWSSTNSSQSVFLRIKLLLICS